MSRQQARPWLKLWPLQLDDGVRPETALRPHGTGGNEDDLSPLGRMVARAQRCCQRAGRLEHGMPRFFRRLSKGVFDEQDPRRRAAELAEAATGSQRRYRGGRHAAARPTVLVRGMLLRAMAPFANHPPASLAAHAGAGILGCARSDHRPENAARLMPR
jgi:phospholipase/carboxylesterase